MTQCDTHDDFELHNDSVWCSWWLIVTHKMNSYDPKWLCITSCMYVCMPLPSLHSDSEWYSQWLCVSFTMICCHPHSDECVLPKIPYDFIFAVIFACHHNFHGFSSQWLLRHNNFLRTINGCVALTVAYCDLQNDFKFPHSDYVWHYNEYVCPHYDFTWL